MENNAPCKIVGLITVRIKMVENLITLSSLNAKEYKCSGKREVIKVRKRCFHYDKGAKKECWIIYFVRLYWIK